MRKLKFVGLDSWDRPVYRDEKRKLWKDVNLGRGEPYLHCSSGNGFEGEPGHPIKGEYAITEPYRENPHRFDYMMLDVLKRNCDHFYGSDNGEEAINIADTVKEMKKHWHRLPEDEKPEWLTWEQILEYGKGAINA